MQNAQLTIDMILDAISNEEGVLNISRIAFRIIIKYIYLCFETAEKNYVDGPIR